MAVRRACWGWVVCFCSLVQFVIVMGILFSYGEVVRYFTREFNASMTMVDWVGATSVFFPMAAAPVSIFLNGILGTMKTVMIGVFISSLGLMLTALASSIFMILATLGFVFGIGATLIVNPPYLLLDEYFPIDHPRHALATSIGTCAYPLGVLIFNPMMYAMLHNYGWQVTYGVLSGLLFVAGMLTSLSFHQSGDAHLDKQEVVPDRTVKHKELYENLEENQKDVSTQAKFTLGTLWFLASTLKAIGYYTPFLILVKHMDSLGIPQDQAANMMTIIALGELLMRFITSFLGDYLKGKLLIIYTVFCVALSVENLLGSYAQSYGAILGFGIVLGISGGPIIAALFPTSAEVLAGRHVPTVFSIARLGFGFGGLFGPIMAGIVYDTTGSYTLVFRINCGSYLFTAIFYLSIIIVNHKQSQFLWESPRIRTDSKQEMIIPKCASHENHIDSIGLDRQDHVGLDRQESSEDK